MALAAFYMGAEVVGGVLTGSLALLADAGHMLSDVAALALALLASWVASRPSGARWTYGRTRAEILAALGQGVGLVAVAILIVIEAVERLGEPPEVMGSGLLAIATGGLLVNLGGLWILNAGRHESLNVQGAWLHVLSDALGSVGAMTAGVLVWSFGWNWADPAASLAICALVLYSAWHLLREAVDILMEAAPRHLDVEEIRSAIAGLGDVSEVHDLHVWTIGSGKVSLSCHVVATRADEAAPLLSEIYSLLGNRFGIDHATIQIEPEGFAGQSPRLICDGGCPPGQNTTPAPARLGSSF
jgi:cobalt-zinc-cadmium efflux system protein